MWHHMTSVAESTASKEPEAKRKESISNPPSREPASEQPGEPPEDRITGFLSSPWFSHSANASLRAISLRERSRTTKKAGLSHFSVRKSRTLPAQRWRRV